MNLFKFSKVASVPLAALLGAAALHAQAQAGALPSQANKPVGQDIQALLAQNKMPQPGLAEIHGNAKALARGGDAVAAEKALTAQSKFTPNTANWHMETSHSLIWVAGDLAREGNAKTVPALTTSALQHLQQVTALAKDNHTKAGAQAATGYIHEHFTGDPTAAIASYQAALQLEPDNPAIKQTLTRLQMADATLRARIHPAKH